MCKMDEICSQAEAATLHAMHQGQTVAEAKAAAIAAAEAHEPELLTDDFRKLLETHVARIYTEQGLAMHSATH